MLIMSCKRAFTLLRLIMNLFPNMQVKWRLCRLQGCFSCNGLAWMLKGRGDIKKAACEKCKYLGEIAKHESL